MDRRTFIFSALGMLGLTAAGGLGYIHSPRFGRPAGADRLKKMQASPHFVDGHFQCLEPVNVMTSDESFLSGWIHFLMEDKTGKVPASPLPSKKTDLKRQPSDEEFVVWMGHSSFYMQLAGRRILIDPVFSSYASPIFFVNRAFPGTNIYKAEDIPDIDILVISHDHWDHLDYPTIKALQPRIRTVVCPLGVGEYFEQWGFDPSCMHEDDWGADIAIDPDFHIHILPSQHFSGRMLEQNGTEWAAFAFVTSAKKVFYSGDGGYSPHFLEIGRQFGSFDLALMENGQYDLNWHQIHMLPRETAQAACDVRAQTVISMHNSKFALARHTWQAPLQELSAFSKGQTWTLLTPRIGEKVAIGSRKELPRWWEQV